jgi:hypothetical protein
MTIHEPRAEGKHSPIGDRCEHSQPAPLMSKTVAVIPPLPLADQRYLEEREKIVGAGLKASIVAAKALHEIKTYRDGKLWKANYESFPAYCRGRWGYAKARTYQLLASGELIHEIEAQVVASESEISDWMPTNESHLWPLLKLQPDKRGECWKAVVKKKKPGELNAKIVKGEMVKFAKAQGLPLETKRAKPRISDKKKAAATLAKLQATIAALPEADRITALLAKVKDLIG